MMRIACSALIALFALCFSSAHAQDAAPQWSLAIHGGAGVIERSSLTPEQDVAYRAALQGALDAGSAVLKSGGSALDAVQAAVQVMEDDPLFNAGRGAVFTAAGHNELDAAVMDGSDLTAGSVAGLTTTRHPVAAARAVMERSPHVMLIGPGADAFAASVGLEQVDPAFFFTERRWHGLVKALTEAGQPIPERPAGPPASPTAPGAQAEIAPPLNEKKFGTVGAVALDSQGRLAAATSTGGMTAKRWGRVGDVPIIGAGTYASNADDCAVSATGDGEYFIRATVARDICARIAGGAATQAAGQAEIADADRLGGKGGVIVMGLDGRPAFAMSTSGMYRGAASSTDPARVAIYADEP
ncbi:isoaspartyl peptidase/L-asparaginase family protein [Brevundimonas vesicularis]|uniref:isoaspartyl peptidase/L-asparaginase family protein n=1 Tax=Brevundimonas vesicularis TaxID=41276 RepID=UPI0022AC48C8|nr:isoaspartyl peptidase/L-asparaginase [Brevundimonas vesicularis]